MPLLFTKGNKIMEQKDTRIITNEKTGETRVLTVWNGGVSEEQIKVWKNEYRKVYAIEVEDEEDLYIGYFRRPNLETMSAVNKIAKTDEIKSTTIMFDNCWLGGEPVMKTDTLVRIAAIKQLGEMFNRVMGTLKNL